MMSYSAMTNAQPISPPPPPPASAASPASSSASQKSATPPTPPQPTGGQKILLFFDRHRRLVILLSVLFILADMAIFIFYRTHPHPISVSIESSPQEQNLTTKSLSTAKSLLAKLLHNSSLTEDQPAPTPTPKPTPKPIGTGQQIFKFSHGSDVTGPKLQTVTLDPIDPQSGQTQTITAVIKHDSPVISAQVMIETDHTTITQALKLSSGTNQDGTWQAQLKLKDSYDYNYYIKFNLQSSTGNYQGGLRLRQP